MIRSLAVGVVVCGLALLDGPSDGAWTTPREVAPSHLSPDSALEELSVGRYWHAARIMRAEGFANGGADEVVALAEAEAGWGNWSGALELLEDLEVAQPRRASVAYLTGQALEEAERWDEAAEAYSLYVNGGSGESLLPARARLARALWRADDRTGALGILSELHGAPSLRSWTGVELIREEVQRGDVEAVRALLRHVVEPHAAADVWRAEADVLIQAGDSVAALTVFAGLTNSMGDRLASVAAVEMARLSIALGDTVSGRAMLEEEVDRVSGTARTRAAAALVDLGRFDYETTLRFAQTLDRAGDGRRALIAYDRAWLQADSAGVPFPMASRVERARIMSTVASRQEEALEEFRAVRDSVPDGRIAARNLEVWTQMRRRQGRTGDVSTLRRWLLEEHPSSEQAISVAWSRATTAEGNGSVQAALDGYAAISEHAPTHTRAGQGRMRSGQILLRRNDLSGAASVYEAYLEDFPSGRRWQEAGYWAGRLRLELGDSVAGRAHLERVLSQPVEYYAVMAADLLGVPFAVDMAEGEASVEPGWLSEGLRRLDLLDEAGLERGADAEIERLERRGGTQRGPRLRLAEALIERGRTMAGINLGWALLRDEGSWDQQILGVTYPFPYRELVRREAAEWGIDPFMMAAIIRQESAFEADIVSHAGAIGLMQVMPPTGAELARRHGPDEFTGSSLTTPEVNLHLGAAFFVDMSRRYDGDLPIVLSAYNAGPTRATRWRRYPEAGDPLRFTERIPFTETRGYVKSVRRNLGLYRAIYGQDQ